MWICRIVSVAFAFSLGSDALADEPVFVDALVALSAGDALVIDARSREDYDRQHVAGAVPSWWQTFTLDEHTGELAAVPELVSLLEAHGVDDNRTTFVYGAWTDGWGEEAHLVWLLRTLGLENSFVVSGGYDALVEAGAPTDATSVVPRRGTIDSSRVPVDPFLSTDDVATLVDTGVASVLDVRTWVEFAGATLFGEARGGHIPGASHRAWSDLLANDGSGLASGLALPTDRPVLVYCTGGVRSAFAWALLHDAGYDVTNYPGSFWAWSARPELPVEVGP
jgi:thiosulfate/3-mercaptopyruvate sulfurtransferase